MVSRPKSLLKRFNESTLVIGVASLAWLLYRSGTKPSRIVYPCQKAAAANCYTFLFYPLFAFLANISKNAIPRGYRKITHSRKGRLFLLASLLSISVLTSGLALYYNVLSSPWSTLAARATVTQKTAEVSVVQVKNNDGLEQALQTAINYLGGISSIVPEGAKVLIKPNIVRPQAPPDTTDPAIVLALINIIKERNPSIIWVGDGSGEGNTTQNFNFLGYSSIARVQGVELVDLNYGDIVDVPVPRGGYVFNSFKFNSKVVEANVFISLACMKTHDTAVVTLGMKNLVGISAGSVYNVPNSANHMQLHDAAQQKGDNYLGGVIADLCSARRINLTIIDGRVAMEGEGPHNGDPVNLGLIIVGKDPVATDTVASSIMGFDAKKIPSLVLGQQKGLGTNDLHQIEIKGETLEEAFYPFAPAQGQSSFQVISSDQLLFYRWKNLLFLPAIISISITVLFLFVSRRQKTEAKRMLIANLANQSSLDDFQPATSQEEEKVAQLSEVSSKQLEDEINDNISSFQLYIKQIEEMSVRLEELTKLLRTGEVPQNAYDLIAEDLTCQMSITIECFFGLRERLELIKSKAMIERAKTKEAATERPTLPHGPEDLRFIRGYKDVIESDWTETGARQKVYSPNMAKWEELVSKMDSALSSLTIDKELAIIEQYLSFTKANPSLITDLEQTEKAISICKQRLAIVLEKWVSTRRGQIEQIINLEANATSVRDQIKELETRFSVGETTQTIYENENNSLQSRLAKLENEILDIRSHLDDMDMIIFRSSELLRSNSKQP